MQTPKAAQVPMCGMGLGHPRGRIRPRIACQIGRQRQQIPQQNPPHQANVTARNGPAPNRAESCATSTVTGAGPSAARSAAV